MADLEAGAKGPGPPPLWEEAPMPGTIKDYLSKPIRLRLAAECDVVLGNHIPYKQPRPGWVPITGVFLGARGRNMCPIMP